MDRTRDTGGASPLDEESRKALLLAEATAADDTDARALLGWAAANVAEEAGDVASAVRGYLEAYNAAPAFRPPLFDLVRIFEQRRSYRNLQRLYDAERKAAQTPRERASALTDLAAFLAGPGQNPAQSLDAQRQSLAHLRESDEGDAGVALRALRVGRDQKDRATVRAALRELFRATRNSELAGEVAIELALEQISNGNVSAAMDALAQGRERLGPLPSLLLATETLARQHGLADVLAEALALWADSALSASGGSEPAPAEAAPRDEEPVSASADASEPERPSLAPQIDLGPVPSETPPQPSSTTPGAVAALTPSRRAEAVARYLEAAAIRRQDGKPEEARQLLARARELAPDATLVTLEYAVQAIVSGAPETLGDTLRSLAEAPDVQPELVAGLAIRGALDLRRRGATAEADTLWALAHDASPADLLVRRAVMARALDEGRLEDAITALEVEGATPHDRLRALVLRRLCGERGESLATRMESLELDGCEAGTRLLFLRWRAEESLASWRGASAEQRTHTRLRAVADLDALMGEASLSKGEAAIWARDRLAISPPKARGRALASVLGGHFGGDEGDRLTALASDLDPEERRLAEIALGEGEDALRLLVQAWVAAASAEDWSILAGVHELLAVRLDAVGEGRHAASQRAAAARAWVRAGDLDAAVAAVAAAKRAPADELGLRYGDALAEEILRERGDLEALRELTARDGDGSGQEVLLRELLRAAARAEDPAQAREKLRQAHELDALESTASWRASLQLALDAGDEALRLESLAELARREGLTLAALAVAEAEAAAPEPAFAGLRGLLDDRSVARDAALALLAHGSVEDTDRALAVLGAGDENAELVGAELALGGPSRSLAHLQAEALHEPSDEDDDERGDPLVPLRGLPRDLVLVDLFVGLGAARGQQRAALLRALGEVVESDALSGELSLQALRQEMLAGGSEVLEDSFFEVEELAELSAAASDPWLRALGDSARDDTITETDDAELRADALGDRDVPGGVLYAAAARASLAAQRADACTLLEASVRADPHDYGNWDAVRVAARHAGRWPLVVEACERLATRLEGAADPEVVELRGDLLEEAGVVLVDEVGDLGRGTALLGEAFLQAPSRRAAFLRLYDIEAERGATDGLLSIVEAHLPTLPVSEKKIRLQYEKARIHRARGELDLAVAAVGELRVLDELHAGGLALLVEIATTRGDWPRAVAALRALTRSDVPAAQKRIAHLGAADFLAQRLNDPAGALVELKAVEALGLADAAVYERMSELAEAAQDDAELARAYQRAAETAPTPEARRELLQRAARRASAAGTPDAAIQAYRNVLAADPTDVDAARGLHQLLPDGERAAQGGRFLSALRTSLANAAPSEALLHALAEAAGWAGKRELRGLTLAALQTLGIATDDERRLLAGWTPPSIRILPPHVERYSDVKWNSVPESVRASFTEAFGLTREAFARSLGRTPEALELKREHRLSDSSAWFNFTTALAAAFGLEVEEVYAAPLPGNASFVFGGRKGRVGAVLGEISAETKRSVVAALARQFYYARFGAETVMGMRRDDALAWLCGAFAVADAPLDAGRDRTGVVEATRNLQPFIGRREKRALATLASRMPAAQPFAQVMREFRYGAEVAAFIASADLPRALRTAGRGNVGFESLSYEPELLEMLRFALSADLEQVRAVAKEIP